MGLLAEYGSDSGSDDEGPAAAGPSRPPITPAAPPAHLAKPPGKKRAAVKIGFDLGPLKGDEDEDAPKPPQDASRKRPKLGDAGKGKGKSALLDMLPAPKRALPPSKTAPAPTTPVPSAVVRGNGEVDLAQALGGPGLGDEDEKETTASFAPRNVGKKAAKAAQAKPAAMDFFGIAEASPAPVIPAKAAPPPSSISITSAPEVKDYVPPPPTANDPYPGYYQLPSGAWAAYDREYYMSCFNDAEDDGPVGRDWDGVDKLDQEGMQKIDVAKDMEYEKKLLEERKKLTAVEPSYEESKYKPIGKTTGGATKKHQLTALLKDAHMNRRAMEETIAGNKRKKREAGTKYGF